ncbi:unnamed protein product [Rotaria sp. Silwood1]|nr:unnamed protein product [Rotaria sp. Silwood1]CAF4844911.1 unnamed protein product [Rotaria sp. Silwood1]
MDIVAYSNSTIHFIPKNEQRPKESYSNRSLIELLQDKSANYSLRARDLEKNKKEIFDLPLQSHDIYKFGSSKDMPDEIHLDEGIFRLRLQSEGRDQFHNALRQCFEKLMSKGKGSPGVESDRSSKYKTSTGSPSTRTIADGAMTFLFDSVEILDEIHKLSERIQEGAVNETDELVKKLVKSGVQLLAENSKERLDEQRFSIRIIIDGFDSNIKDKDKLLEMNVYPSTKVHELRAVVNKMSLLVYSTGRIQFISNDDEVLEHNYSERSLIQLYYHDNNTYSLNAIDIENNKAEIFNIPLTDSGQYEFGSSEDEPDEIKDLNGTFRLWLNSSLRDSFHETLCAVFEIFSHVESSDTSSECMGDNPSRISFDEMSEPDIPNSINCEAKNISVVPNSKYSYDFILSLRILVQFDGDEYGVEQHGGTISVDVFPSTTVRELRAAFELAYHYSPFNQYFFVNGNLVHDNSTMKDLHVGPNSLFVLFLLEHAKKYKNNNPWECSSCAEENPPYIYKCVVCSASRVE